MYNMSKYSVETYVGPLMRDGRELIHALMDELCYSQRSPHSRLVAIRLFYFFLPALRALDFGPVLVVMLRMATLVVWLCVWFVWLQ